MTGAAPDIPQWLAPAPLWTKKAIGARDDAFRQPWIAELTTDAFLDDFLAILNGATGRSRSDLGGTVPAQSAEDGAFRLFGSKSERYYLVVASLVCRRAGIPDHTVRPDSGERPFFVLRRVDDGGESGFVPAGGTGDYLPAAADALVPGEREMPVHPAPVGAFAAAGTAAAVLGMAAGRPSTRTVFYGYVPVTGGDPATGLSGGTYVIRTVLARPPCAPVLSAATHPFQLVGPLAPDAPVRPGDTPPGVVGIGVPAFPKGPKP